MAFQSANLTRGLYGLLIGVISIATSIATGDRLARAEDGFRTPSPALTMLEKACEAGRGPSGYGLPQRHQSHHCKESAKRSLCEAGIYPCTFRTPLEAGYIACQKFQSDHNLMCMEALLTGLDRARYQDQLAQCVSSKNGQKEYNHRCFDELFDREISDPSILQPRTKAVSSCESRAGTSVLSQQAKGSISLAKQSCQYFH